MAHSLLQAEVLTPAGREHWATGRFGYGYRSSLLKRGEARAVVLSAEMKLSNATPESVAARIAAFSERRKLAQPPGASMGSMFKNPEGDAAGRLIEAAGLKGTRIGNAEVSPIHGNFFINRGDARASDIRALIAVVQERVRERMGVELELEVELVGEWTDQGRG